MATVTPRAIVWNTTAGAKTTGSFQPAAGELLVAVVGIAGNDTAPTMSDTDATITGWTLVDVFRSYIAASTGGLRMYVSNQGANGAAITVTMTPTGDSGGGLAVLSVSGAAAFGASAVAGNGGQADIASGTPAPVLDTTPHVASAIITAVMTNSNVSTNVVPRSGYTEAYDQGFNTPASGIEVAYLNSGETSATLTHGGAAASQFASIGIEIVATQTVSGDVASEADAANAATKIQPQAPVAGGVASESDTAPAGTKIQPQAPVAAGVASESDTAPAGTPVGGAFFPDQIAGLETWLKADAIGGADGDPVTTWQDSHTSNKDATGATGQTLQTNEINSLPVVRFDGVDDTMSVALTNSDATRTVFFVAKNVSNTTGEGVLGWSSSAVLEQGAGNTMRWSLNQAGGSPTVATGTTAGTPYMVALRFNSTSSADSYDGLAAASNFDPNDAYQSGAANLNLGSRTAAASFGNVDIGEVVVYNSALSDTDLDDVRDYLYAKWLAAPQIVNAGVASEADAAVAATKIQPQAPVSGGVASESDTALAATRIQPQAPVSGGVASEADSALAATKIQPQAPVSGGVASEADAALAATKIQPQAPVSGGVASETDSAPAATVNQGGAQTVNAGVGSESDTAPAATKIQPQAPIAGGVASEADAAVSGTKIQPQAPVAAGRAQEADSVPAATVDQGSGPQTVSGGVASEIDAAMAAVVLGGAAPPDTSPALGGYFDETATGGFVVQRNRSGVVTATIRGGLVQGGPRGGEHDETTTGGTHDQSSTGGVVH